MQLCRCGCLLPAPIAPQSHTNRGIKKGDPYPFRKGHATRKNQHGPDDFWGKVTKTSSCWIWNAASDRLGYGRFNVNGVLHLAHRVSWKLANGPAPDDLCILHRCDNPRCVNPSHLFLGTRTDNSRDRSIKNRQVRGEDANQAKLRNNDVLFIRSNRSIPYKQLSLMFGVSTSTISRIATGKTWKHLP